MIEHVEYMRKLSAYNVLTLREEREILDSGPDLSEITSVKQTLLSSIIDEHGTMLNAKRDGYKDSYQENFDKLITSEPMRNNFQ